MGNSQAFKRFRNIRVQRDDTSLNNLKDSLIILSIILIGKKMKKMKIVVTDYSLKDVIGKEIILFLYDNANFIHALKKIDICTRGKFLIRKYPEYHSLLHMVWNPIEQRIYKQIATAAYKNSEFFDIRRNPHTVLPDGLTIYLGLGLCKSEEEVINYERFREAIQNKTLEVFANR